MIGKEHNSLLEKIAFCNGWKVLWNGEGEIRGLEISKVFWCWGYQPYGKNPQFEFSVGLTHAFREVDGYTASKYTQKIRCKVGQSPEAYARKLAKLYEGLAALEPEIFSRQEALNTSKSNAQSAVTKIADFLGKKVSDSSRESDHWYLKGYSKVKVDHGKVTLEISDLTPEKAIEIMESLGLKE